MITVHIPEPWATVIDCVVLLILPSLFVLVMFSLMALVDAIRWDEDFFGVNQKRNR